MFNVWSDRPYFRQCPQILITPRHSRHKPPKKSSTKTFAAKLSVTSSGYVKKSQLWKSLLLLTSSLVHSQSIMFPPPFFSIQEHLIHSCRRVMHYDMNFLLKKCFLQ